VVVASCCGFQTIQDDDNVCRRYSEQDTRNERPRTGEKEFATRPRSEHGDVAAGRDYAAPHYVVSGAYAQHYPQSLPPYGPGACFRIGWYTTAPHLQMRSIAQHIAITCMRHSNGRGGIGGIPSAVLPPHLRTRHAPNRRPRHSSQKRLIMSGRGWGSSSALYP
jgi:hypothetical protein